MKIELRIDPDGAPIIFFPDEQNPHNHRVMCYEKIGQHGEAQRAYMRQCKRPANDAERRSCWHLLREWANLPD